MLRDVELNTSNDQEILITIILNNEIFVLVIDD